jgi:hypothetical protein
MIQDDGGLGNLADELELAYEEDLDEEDMVGSSLVAELEGEDSVMQNGEIQSPVSPRDSRVMNGSIPSPFVQHDQHQSLQLPEHQKSRAKRRATHNRADSSYDGSDYGSDHDDDELASFPPLLRKRMREIEKLARESHDIDALSEGGGVVSRTISGLRTLGPPQSNIEYGITRLATAYQSMATHRTHKQRDIFTSSHSLLYGNASSLPSELLDLLISEITALAETTSFLSPQNPLLSLQILAAQTSDLTNTLRGLTDLLQETRLTTNAATRKLKNVKDMLDDMALEEDLVDHSIMLIQAGDWDRRCRERQAGKMCREVVRAFGERWDIDVPVGREVKG